MSGFKDFYQFVAPTRVVAGRGLIEGLGFEFSKEGAKRVAIITDAVIRGTGLIDKVEEGVRDGGLEVAMVYDAVPPDSDAGVVVAAAEQAKAEGADAFLAVGGGSVMDTAKLSNVIFTHGGEPREWEGYYGLPRDDDGLGQPFRPRAAGLRAHHRGHRLGGLVRSRDQGPRGAPQVPGRGLPHVSAAGRARPGVDAHAPAGHRRGDGHGRDDARDRGLRVARVDAARRRLRARGAAAHPRQPRARGDDAVR